MKQFLFDVFARQQAGQRSPAGPGLDHSGCYTPSNPSRYWALRRKEEIPDQRSHKTEVEVESHTRLRENLVSAVRSVCPRWRLDQQEDLVQIAMMAVLKQQAKLEQKRDFPKSYLRRAAYTALVDEIRRQRSRQEVPLEVDEPSLPPSSSHENPERQTLSQEISRAVRSCVQMLATPRRLAVTLHLLSYKVPQIAERLGWKEKQAENLVYRGVKDLRQCLKTKGITP